MTDEAGPRWREQVVLAMERGDRGLAMALEREHILSAELGALESWQAVLELIGASDDPVSARVSLQAAFDVDETQAETILNLQFWRVGRQEREHRREQLARLPGEITERLAGAADMRDGKP